MQVGAADATSLDADQHLTYSGLWGRLTLFQSKRHMRGVE
jgi:hypothetical protein